MTAAEAKLLLVGKLVKTAVVRILAAEQVNHTLTNGPFASSRPSR